VEELFLVVVFFIGAVLFMALYVSRYWRTFKYLQRRSRAIDFNERQDRQRRELCVECGYDLRGSPGRCPECGTSARDKSAMQPNKTPSN
jgi:hypothetical protein